MLNNVFNFLTIAKWCLYALEAFITPAIAPHAAFQR